MDQICQNVSDMTALEIHKLYSKALEMGGTLLPMQFDWRYDFEFEDTEKGQAFYEWLLNTFNRG